MSKNTVPFDLYANGCLPYTTKAYLCGVTCLYGSSKPVIISRKEDFV